MSKKHPTEYNLIAASSKNGVPKILNSAVASICKKALQERGVFTIALSGGSLAGFLASIADSFEGTDPKFDCWHVILADERCVSTSDNDSNMGSLKKHFFDKTTIPERQIYGIDESLLVSGTTENIATAYQRAVQDVIAKSGGALDLAVLGFGPDGHTCSLFPGHQLLTETEKLVAAIEDSPKPPPKRITLTYRVLNDMTRHVIFCGAGDSKSPILQKVFTKVEPTSDAGCYSVIMARPAPFPCGMVDPQYAGSEESPCTVTWVVDADAMKGVKP